MGADSRRPALLDLLEGYAPTAPDAIRHRSATLEHVRATARPFDRDDTDPGHVTASGFVLHPGGGSVLLVLHRTVGRWIQPGGHVDPADPSPGEAAAREIVEETGVTGLRPIGLGLLDVDVHRYPAREGGDPAHLHFDLRFGFRAESDGLEPADEVVTARWVPVGDLEVLERSVRRPATALLRLS
ncbi:MAG: NUDIX domain-containing protein [Acidimicrobiia bacterium]|nr:NUDIX domain-containing protein [Acidimicrobiia bacterium]